VSWSFKLLAVACPTSVVHKQNPKNPKRKAQKIKNPTKQKKNVQERAGWRQAVRMQ